jgi:DNA-binding NarL/FixJ family response regulator
LEENGCVRVVIVDDQAIFREAARHCLNARGYDVVAEAGCAVSAIEAVERYRPNAMLLDVQLGDHDGFAVCDAVTRIRPDLAVVLTSAENKYEQIPERIESCGARGFVRKEHLARVDFGRFWQAA